VSQKFTNWFVPSFQPSWRKPESMEFKDFWISASAGMTLEATRLFQQTSETKDPAEK
jgi:hypothetical protein